MLKKGGYGLIGRMIILGVLISGLFALPLKINYQGRLTNNNEPVNTTKTMYFSIKETSGGTTVWGPVQQNVNVVNGVYTVALEPPQSVFESSEQLQLHIKVDTVDLSPDILLLAVPYAYIAQKAETVADNQILNGYIYLTGSTGMKVSSANDLLTFEY